MTSATRFGSVAPALSSSRSAALPSPARPNLFRRIIDAVAESNRRKAEREIAAFIRRNGGKLTDSLERGIERSFL